MPSAGISILHTNDFHGNLSSDLLSKLAAVRAECDLYFDSGDIIKAGNLAIPLKDDQSWPRLRELNCTASVPGNRETHINQAAIQAKLRGLSHPMLCANWFDRAGKLVFPASLETVINGIKIGVFGVMVPMVTKQMATAPLSAYLWSPPISAAEEIVEELRPRVDLLIALTHIGNRQDQLLAMACPTIDLILGGHSHTILESPQAVGTVVIAQGGSHGRYYGRYEWSPETGISGGLVPLKQP